MIESPARRLARTFIPRSEMEVHEAEERKRWPDVDPGLLESMRPTGAEWHAHFEERGFVCPASLVELADLAGEVCSMRCSGSAPLGGWL